MKMNCFHCQDGALCSQPRISLANEGMKRHEYIQIQIDMGDLAQLNSLASVGFRVIAVVRCPVTDENYALLERELPD